MAILKHLPNIQVVICTMDGEPIREYIDDTFRDTVGPYERLRTLSNHVKVTPNQEFYIGLYVKLPYDRPFDNLDCPAISFDVFVDGLKVAGPLLRKSDPKLEGKQVWHVDVKRVRDLEGSGDQASLKLKKFRFSAISIAMADYGLPGPTRDFKNMGRIGEIVVRVNRRLEVVLVAPELARNEVTGSNETIAHESIQSGETELHGVCAGAVKPMEAPKYEYKMMDGEQNPIGIFRFLYKSGDTFQSNFMPPSAPEQEPPFPAPALVLRIKLENLNSQQKSWLEDFINQLIHDKKNPRNMPSLNVENQNRAFKTLANTPTKREGGGSNQMDGGSAVKTPTKNVNKQGAVSPNSTPKRKKVEGHVLGSPGKKTKVEDGVTLVDLTRDPD